MSSAAYEEWKAKNPPRPDNEWERFKDRVKDYERVEREASEKEGK